MPAINPNACESATYIPSLRTRTKSKRSSSYVARPIQPELLTHLCFLNSLSPRPVVDMGNTITMMRPESTTNFQDLPEDCIAHILSLTTPVDASVLSLVSKTFCSAAQADAVWDRFLPSDLKSIVSESSEPSLIATSPSTKTLFLTLSDRPILVDHGRKSFQLDKRTGKKCCMIAPRDLYIIWSDVADYWDWTPMPESRFGEVARLVAVCWFEINGKINTRVLSPGTQYAVFLVFMMIDAQGFHHHPMELSVGIIGDQNCTKNVCLDPNLEEMMLDANFQGLERPNMRQKDGWLEIEMGEFFNSGLEDEVEIRVAEAKSNMWKHGFLLQGIEVRPKLPSI